jgi:hypothetical protein
VRLRIRSHSLVYPGVSYTLTLTQCHAGEVKKYQHLRQVGPGHPLGCGEAEGQGGQAARRRTAEGGGADCDGWISLERSHDAQRGSFPLALKNMALAEAHAHF